MFRRARQVALIALTGLLTQGPVRAEEDSTRLARARAFLDAGREREAAEQIALALPRLRQADDWQQQVQAYLLLHAVLLRQAGRARTFEAHMRALEPLGRALALLLGRAEGGPLAIRVGVRAAHAREAMGDFQGAFVEAMRAVQRMDRPTKGPFDGSHPLVLAARNVQCSDSEKGLAMSPPHPEEAGARRAFDALVRPHAADLVSGIQDASDADVADALTWAARRIDAPAYRAAIDAWSERSGEPWESYRAFHEIHWELERGRFQRALELLLQFDPTRTVADWNTSPYALDGYGSGAVLRYVRKVAQGLAKVGYPDDAVPGSVRERLSYLREVYDGARISLNDANRVADYGFWKPLLLDWLRVGERQPPSTAEHWVAPLLLIDYHTDRAEYESALQVVQAHRGDGAFGHAPSWVRKVLTAQAVLLSVWTHQLDAVGPLVQRLSTTLRDGVREGYQVGIERWLEAVQPILQVTHHLRAEQTVIAWQVASAVGEPYGNVLSLYRRRQALQLGSLGTVTDALRDRLRRVSPTDPSAHHDIPALVQLLHDVGAEDEAWVVTAEGLAQLGRIPIRPSVARGRIRQIDRRQHAAALYKWRDATACTLVEATHGALERGLIDQALETTSTAEAIARTALLRDRPSVAWRPRLLLLRAYALLLQGQAAEALETARLLGRELDASNWPRVAAHLHLAEFYLRAGEADEAIAQLGRIREDTLKAAAGNPLFAFAWHRLAGALALQRGSPAEAARAFRTARTHVAIRGEAMAPDEVRVALAQALALHRSGQASKGRRVLREALEAIDVLDKSLRWTTTEPQRRALQRFLMEVLRVQVAMARPDSNADYATTLHTRALVRQAAMPGALERGPGGALAAARRRLATRVHDRPPLRTGPWARAAWRAQVAAASREVAEIEREQRTHARSREERGTFKRSAQRVAALRRSLRSGDVLLDIVTVGDAYHAWRVDPEGVTGPMRLGDASTLEARCEALIEKVQEAETTSAWRAVATEEPLVRDLQPILRGLQGARRVIIVPSGAFAGVPWAVLPLGGAQDRFLVESTTVVLRPSSESGDRRQRSRPGRALLVGGIQFDKRVWPDEETTTGSAARRPRPLVPHAGVAGPFVQLPATAEEVADVEKMLAAMRPPIPVQRLGGAGVGEAALAEAARGADLLHIATHGFLRPHMTGLLRHRARSLVRPGLADLPFTGVLDPLLTSGLALSGANLRYEEGGDDGVLTAIEAGDLELDACALVYLSACQSGLRTQSGGAASLGLVDAFLRAGAESVIATFWPIDDAAARTFALDFYGRLGDGQWKERPETALGAAQRQAATDERPPRHWAAFALHTRLP